MIVHNYSAHSTAVNRIISADVDDSPAILIVQFFIFPSKSSHCIVYPLILDCTVNDMLDIIRGEDDVRSV